MANTSKSYAEGLSPHWTFVQVGLITLFVFIFYQNLQTFFCEIVTDETVILSIVEYSIIKTAE